MFADDQNDELEPEAHDEDSSPEEETFDTVLMSKDDIKEDDDDEPETPQATVVMSKDDVTEEDDDEPESAPATVVMSKESMKDEDDEPESPQATVVMSKDDVTEDDGEGESSSAVVVSKESVKEKAAEGAESGSEDWQTVQMPQSKPSTPPPAPTVQMSTSDVESTSEGGDDDGWASAPSAAGSAPKAAPTTPPPVDATPAPEAPPVVESGGPNSIGFMENLGIKSPQTQRIVLGVVIGGFLLCCLCSCAAFAVSTLGIPTT